MATDKPATPGYGSFKSLTTFFNARRDDGHITTVVDRSLLSNFNGSTANELLATLRFLKMIDDKGKPSAIYEAYVTATDAGRKPLLASALRDAYPFVFQNPDFNIERETGGRMAELFRAQGISGSTLSRAISFFLAAAKDADVKVSTNIKPPLLQKVTKARKAGQVQTPGQNDDDGVDDAEEDDDVKKPPGSQSFEIPIPINRKVRILIPQDWSPDDWDLFQVMLKAYIDGWKHQTLKAKKSNSTAAKEEPKEGAQ